MTLNPRITLTEMSELKNWQKLVKCWIYQVYITLYILYIIYTLIIVKEIEKKWRNLRTQYAREKGKMKKRKTGDGLDDVYVTKWKHYKQLEFLEDFVTPRASQSNLQVFLSNNVILPLYTSSC